jgi:hypothetical protein
VIENPADYDNLAAAPVGAGEPYAPPADQAHFDRQAEGAYDDFQAQLREEARTYSSLATLVVAALAPGADMHELTGLPRDLGDERITFTDLQFLGFLGDALKFRLLTTVAGQPLDDTVDLRWDTLPMNAALLAGVVPALRTHVLKRAGLLDGSPDQVVLDEHGHPVEVQP